MEGFKEKMEQLLQSNKLYVSRMESVVRDKLEALTLRAMEESQRELVFEKAYLKVSVIGKGVYVSMEGSRSGAVFSAEYSKILSEEDVINISKLMYEEYEFGLEKVEDKVLIYSFPKL